MLYLPTSYKAAHRLTSRIAKCKEPHRPTIGEELILPAAVDESYDRWVCWVFRTCSNEVSLENQCGEEKFQFDSTIWTKYICAAINRLIYRSNRPTHVIVMQFVESAHFQCKMCFIYFN